MSTPIRRSKRARTATKKYTTDGWDETTLDGLQASSPESRSGAQNQGRPSSDEEFDIRETRQRSDDEVSLDENNAFHSTATPHQIFDSLSDDGLGQEARSSIARGKSKVRNWKPPPSEHSRGVQNLERRLGKTSIFRASYGPAADDIQEALQARDRWHLNGRDGAFPSLMSLEIALQNEWSLETLSTKIDVSGFNLTANSFGQQKLQRCSYSQISDRRFLSSDTVQELVIGAQHQQRLFNIPYLGSLDFGKAWTKPSSAHLLSPEDKPQAAGRKNGDQPLHDVKSHHQGWLINAGEKVQSISWTSCAPSSAQYLAVACRAASSQRQTSRSEVHDSAAAFTPSAGYPSSIQIWKFAMQKLQTSNLLSMDFNTPPKLVQVFACSFGDIKEMKWVPKVPTAHEAAIDKELGRLGLLTTDGCMRVLSIPFPHEDDIPDCYEITTAAICITPSPESIFTTFVFCGTGDLLLGASNGTVQAYNLAATAESFVEIEPYLTLQLHVTYVLQITTAGAGSLSHFIVSTSAAGDLRLTDLRAPNQDTVHLSRARLPTRNLIYHPSTQSFITSIDRSGRTDIVNAQTAIVAHQLRHFYTQLYLCKFPNNTGTATALAGSQLHPYILIGNSQGTVMCQNVLRRMLPRAGGWITTVCEYDWIPAEPRNSVSATDLAPQAMPGNSTRGDNGRTREGEPYHGSNTQERNEHTSSREPSSNDKTNANSDNSLYYGHDVRPGRSRFREGFIPKMIDLKPETSTNNAATTATGINKGKGKGPTAKGKSKAQSKTVAKAGTKDKARAKAQVKSKGKGKGDGKATSNLDDGQEGNATVTESHEKNLGEDVDMNAIDDGDENGHDDLHMDTNMEEAVDEGRGNPVAEVIFEEEQAVTCIQWNEDPRCAALAAMGWGSGILRIEDLSVDVE